MDYSEYNGPCAAPVAPRRRSTTGRLLLAGRWPATSGHRTPTENAAVSRRTASDRHTRSAQGIGRAWSAIASRIGHSTTCDSLYCRCHSPVLPSAPPPGTSRPLKSARGVHQSSSHRESSRYPGADEAADRRPAGRASRVTGSTHGPWVWKSRQLAQLVRRKMISSIVTAMDAQRESQRTGRQRTAEAEAKHLMVAALQRQSTWSTASPWADK